MASDREAQARDNTRHQEWYLGYLWRRDEGFGPGKEVLSRLWRGVSAPDGWVVWPCGRCALTEIKNIDIRSTGRAGPFEMK